MQVPMFCQQPVVSSAGGTTHTKMPKTQVSSQTSRHRSRNETQAIAGYKRLSVPRSTLAGPVTCTHSAGQYELA
ncbi:uncharacterized protein SEPMUDRAFT_145968 [Sphaerulina musiva SO2202]|uniref:Uncharacterized protein n=1 Tax=Sphaerulina musiva (strain SO2202) TaxID=692275 RepID=N1QLW8_SPHMS|nr:uncharacterized protein SEPMUDRAFT_145968 [Sphaerulina musiva SO2202]EMF16828.1 hypothetical protein SEPMUDRAFT_145968 [Sphaerulina musiva SO2202]